MKLQQQLCAEGREAKASAPAAATKDDTVYLDAEGEGAADQSEEIAALHITIAALRSEVEESRSRGQDEALDISAVRKTAAAEASAVAETRIEELEREVIQLRGAAADAVGQLHKATNAVTTQRNRTHAADDALAFGDYAGSDLVYRQKNGGSYKVVTQRVAGRGGRAMGREELLDMRSKHKYDKYCR